MKRANPKDWLLAGGVLLLRRRRRPRLDPGEREPVVPAGEPSPRAELLALALLGAGALLAIGFIVVYAVDRIPHQTQFLGLCLGLSLLSIAAALVVTARRLVVTEEIEDEYPLEEHPDEQETIAATIEPRRLERIKTPHDTANRNTTRPKTNIPGRTVRIFAGASGEPVIGASVPNAVTRLYS